MINERYAKQYCKGDISKIENYDKAINDKTQTWECHHRRETIYSKFDLIEINEYYNRPAIELIFLNKTEHRALHNTLFFKGKTLSKETKRKISKKLKGVKRSDETKRKISEYRKGTKSSDETKRKMSESMIGKNAGKKHTEETKQKMSKSRIGKGNGMFGKKRSEETKRKMSESRKLYWQQKNIENNYDKNR